MIKTLTWRGCVNTGAKHSAHLRLRGCAIAQLCVVLFCMPVSPLVIAKDSADSDAARPAVALASSFRILWPALMEVYQSETGAEAPRTSFASSGLLTTQIRHGAPFELFLSADTVTITTLQKLDKTKGAGTVLAYGELALLATPTAAEQVTGLQSLGTQGSHEESFKIAMPNARHAPYGVAARQALTSAGLWPLAPGQILAAENAAQALQFALSGAVDFAIVPVSLVKQVPASLRVLTIAPESYTPVVHQIVLLSAAGSSATRLYEWLQGEAAADVLIAFGLDAAH